MLCNLYWQSCRSSAEKGNDNVQTLHRLLYDHKPLPAGGFMRIKKTLLEYDIVVVDEVSMVPKEMIDLLFKHKVYVICLGDPFQIPPIEKIRIIIYWIILMYFLMTL